MGTALQIPVCIFVILIKVFFFSPNEPTDRQTNRELRRTNKNRRLDFSIEPTIYLQTNRRKNDQLKIDRRKTDFAKDRSILVPVTLVGFPLVRRSVRWSVGLLSYASGLVVYDSNYNENRVMVL